MHVPEAPLVREELEEALVERARPARAPRGRGQKVRAFLRREQVGEVSCRRTPVVLGRDRKLDELAQGRHRPDGLWRA